MQVWVAANCQGVLFGAWSVAECPPWDRTWIRTRAVLALRAGSEQKGWEGSFGDGRLVAGTTVSPRSICT